MITDDTYINMFEGNLNHASSGTECGVVNASNGYMSSHVYGSMVRTKL